MLAASGFDRARFREVLGHFATGVTVVTASIEGRPVGFTCQSFCSLSLDPPLVLVAPAKTSTSWPDIQRSERFCVNVLADHQEALCRAFAVSGGDKFTGVGWHPGATGSPVLDGVLAWVECHLEATYEGGDHLIAIAKVTDMSVGEGRPLLFYRGGFSGLGP